MAAEEISRNIIADRRFYELLEGEVERILERKIAAVIAALEGARPSSATVALNAKGDWQYEAKEYDVTSMEAMKKAIAAALHGREELASARETRGPRQG